MWTDNRGHMQNSMRNGVTLTLTDTGGAVLTLTLGYRSLYITWQQHTPQWVVLQNSMGIEFAHTHLHTTRKQCQTDATVCPRGRIITFTMGGQLCTGPTSWSVIKLHPLYNVKQSFVQNLPIASVTKHICIIIATQVRTYINHILVLSQCLRFHITTRQIHIIAHFALRNAHAWCRVSTKHRNLPHIFWKKRKSNSEFVLL